VNEAPWAAGASGEAAGWAAPCIGVTDSGEALFAWFDATEDARNIKHCGLKTHVFGERNGSIFGFDLKITLLNGLNGLGAGAGRRDASRANGGGRADGAGVVDAVRGGEGGRLKATAAHVVGLALHLLELRS